MLLILISLSWGMFSRTFFDFIILVLTSAELNSTNTVPSRSLCSPVLALYPFLCTLTMSPEFTPSALICPITSFTVVSSSCVPKTGRLLIAILRGMAQSSDTPTLASIAQILLSLDFAKVLTASTLVSCLFIEVEMLANIPNMACMQSFGSTASLSLIF